MNRHKRITQMFVLLLVLVLLYGCQNGEEIENIANKRNFPTNPFSDHPSSYNYMNEEWYLNKIWIGMVYDSEEYRIADRERLCSFHILSIDEGKIEGRIALDEKALREY